MTIIELNKKDYSVPTEWNELSRKQLLNLMKVFTSGYTADQTMLQCFRILTGISWWRFFKLWTAEIEEWLHLLDFLFKKNDLTKNSLCHYRGTFGPSDDFGNVRGCEYTFADDYFLKYKANKQQPDISALNQLVSVLYRPKRAGYDVNVNPLGDPREEFSETECTYRAKNQITFWPLHVKLAIAAWYEGCRESLRKQYERYFDNSSGTDPLFGFVSVMRSVAAGRVHGDFRGVENTYIHLIFMELAEMKAENEKK